MTAPAFEEVPMPPLPEPARRQGQQMSYDGHDKAFFDCYDNAQMLAYGKECRNAALEEAAKLRKLIADHNDECVRMCDSRFAYGPTQCPMRAYNRQCPDCPKDGMVEVPALRKEIGDA